MDVEYTGYKNVVGQVHLARDRDQQEALMSLEMSILIQQEVDNLLTS